MCWLLIIPYFSLPKYSFKKWKCPAFIRIRTHCTYGNYISQTPFCSSRWLCSHSLITECKWKSVQSILISLFAWQLLPLHFLLSSQSIFRTQNKETPFFLCRWTKAKKTAEQKNLSSLTSLRAERGDSAFPRPWASLKDADVDLIYARVMGGAEVACSYLNKLREEDGN